MMPDRQIERTVASGLRALAIPSSLGILVITDISTFGWLITNVGTAPRLLLWAAVIALVALTAGIFLVHRRIDRHIQSLRQL